MRDYADFTAAAHAKGALVTAVADLLALEDPIHINIERVDDTTRRITLEGVEV